MTCKICGRPSAAGAKLCPDCRAARKRAYDATITQPLMALAGAGTVSRTLSRLRRSDASPEARARRAARKAEAAAAKVEAAVEAPAKRKASARPLLWAWLTIGVVIAAIAGWYIPNHPTATSDLGAGSSASPSPPGQGAALPGAETSAVKVAEPPPPSVGLPPLPTIVERELVPHSPAPGKPALSKRVVAAPKAAAPAPEVPPEIAPVRVSTPAPVVAPPPPAPRIDPWQQMGEAIGRCPSGFLDRVMCEQRIRLQYCEGHWGQVAQCPGGPSVDHN